ncbi:hypothetical protein BBJ28_00004583 [Nothophytophthora sp. Chile5]|nr:hypothetical protein BBJ28_00004583 [Nothophytophthora sp. Chile5]
MAGGLRWTDDGVEPGSPSSLDVLLRWLVMPGNFARYQRPSTRDQSIFEVRTMLVKEGIQPRSPCAIQMKMWALMKQFHDAEQWLKEHGLHDFAANAAAKRQVLRLCPHYPKLGPVMRRVLSPSAVAQTFNDKSDDGSETESESAFDAVYQDTTSSLHCEREVLFRNSVPSQLPQDALRRAVKQARHESSKRPAEDTQVEEEPSFCKAEVREAERVALRNEEQEERRKLFQYELQVKHDEAVCVRALKRQKMLRAGIAREEVDRLLPQ